MDDDKARLYAQVSALFDTPTPDASGAQANPFAPSRNGTNRSASGASASSSTRKQRPPKAAAAAAATSSRRPEHARPLPVVPGTSSRGSTNVTKNASAAPTTFTAIAEKLLQSGLHLTALELHQELREREGGNHSVAPLDIFFSKEIEVMPSAGVEANATDDATNGTKKTTAELLDLEQHPSQAQPLPRAPFGGPESLHQVLRDKADAIALLKYRLRCAHDDLRDANEAVVAASPAPPSRSSSLFHHRGSTVFDQVARMTVAAYDEKTQTTTDNTSPPRVSTEEEELGPITDGEKHTINTIVHGYLKETGLKLTALTMANERAHLPAGHAAASHASGEHGGVSHYFERGDSSARVVRP